MNGGHADFTIGMTQQPLFVDVATMIAPDLISYLTATGACGSLLAGPPCRDCRPALTFSP